MNGAKQYDDNFVVVVVPRSSVVRFFFFRIDKPYTELYIIQLLYHTHTYYRTNHKHTLHILYTKQHTCDDCHIIIEVFFGLHFAVFFVVTCTHILYVYRHSRVYTTTRRAFFRKHIIYSVKMKKKNTFLFVVSAPCREHYNMYDDVVHT